MMIGESGAGVGCVPNAFSGGYLYENTMAILEKPVVTAEQDNSGMNSRRLNEQRHIETSEY